MIKKNDIILVIVIMVLCLGCVLLLQLTKKEGSKVVVTVDGEVYATYDLDENKSFTVKGENGEINTFQIKDEKVDMIDASCPDKLCVKQNPIHYNHETIVCLPNKVVIEVIGSDESDVDMIAN